MRRFFLLIIVLFLVAGCAAFEAAKLARTQTILVKTPYAEGAKCSITDARGRSWSVRKTPSSVPVEDGHSPLHVVCKKKGHKTTTMTVRETKEELLTIDGERVSVGIYDQFPVKMPRLIPTAIKEASSFVLDPTGNISTKYPEEIIVWMEPEKWESKEQMVAWAYDREIEGNRDFIEEEEDRIKDEKRKEIRRIKKNAREEKRKELYEKSIDVAKKALDVETYVEFTKTGVGYTFDKTAAVSKGAVDTGTIALVGTGQIAQEVGEGLSDMSDTVDIKGGIDWLKAKSEEYNIPWNLSEDSKWKHYKDSKLKKSKWVPNWLNLRHSTVSKVGNMGRANYNNEIEDSAEVVDVEEIKPLGDIPPWISESRPAVEE
ncbi:MAG: hypothetical protein PQ612_06605 [Rickettsiales bacterium]|nr:hypothetical protein [Pseudomonadota bacterium]MDA0966644.1 hypothetical protein [Pseudomonadota bacterium]MDG4543672.1 hypothetical protein [Rickettsiales bacterium]MDG4545819.1 hypothetical protein [Rickettsiales bacterium]MDG4547407.1 hypothetical protein [Rickettsiales bacterium]